MIVVLKHNPNRDQLESLIAWLQEKGITSWVWWATPLLWTST